MRKRIGTALLGGLLSIALVGMNVCAAGSLTVIEGATGTYVKGSKQDHIMKVQASDRTEVKGITVDGNELEPEHWNLQGPEEEAPTPTSEAPTPTSEAPVPTSEAPVPTSEAPVPTSEAPVPTSEAPVPTSEAPVPTSEAPVPTSAAPTPTSAVPTPTSAIPDIVNYNLFSPIKVQAAETDTKVYTFVISGTYLETLSIGQHEVVASIWDDGEEKSASAKINVVEQSVTPSEAPETTQAPEATTEEENTDGNDDEDESESTDDTEDESESTTKKKNDTTSSKKKATKKSKSSKTGDNSQIMLYLAVALVSGCAIVYFARKKVR